MHKEKVIEELEAVVATLKMDRRSYIRGIKVMVCEYDWERKKEGNDSNLFIDWVI